MKYPEIGFSHQYLTSAF